jgi:hypothetical protein
VLLENGIAISGQMTTNNQGHVIEVARKIPYRAKTIKVHG